MAKQGSIQLMTKGSIAKQIIGYAVPIFIGYLFQQLYNTVDALIVGNFLGQNALAAVTSVGSLVFLIVGFFNGFATGASVIVANAIGAQDENRTKKAVYTTATFGILLGLIMTGIGYLLTDQMLMWMGSPQEVFDLSSIYLKIYFLGGFSLVLYNMLVGIIRAGGDAKHPLYYLIVSSILNVILDIIFIAVFKMGVAVAAVATVIAQTVSALGCFIYTFKKYPQYRLHKDDFARDIKFNIKHLKLGLPLAFQFSILCIGLIVMQAVIVKFDTDPTGIVVSSYAQNGFGAATKLNSFLMCPFNALGTAMLSYCGQNFGANDQKRIKKGVTQALIISFVFGIF